MAFSFFKTNKNEDNKIPENVNKGSGPTVIEFGNSTTPTIPLTDASGGNVDEAIVNSIFSQIPVNNTYLSFYKSLELLSAIPDLGQRFNTALVLVQKDFPGTTILELVDDYEKIQSILEEAEKALEEEKKSNLKTDVEDLQEKIDAIEEQERNLQTQLDDLKIKKEELQKTKTKNQQDLDTRSNNISMTITYLSRRELNKVNDIKKYLTPKGS